MVRKRKAEMRNHRLTYTLSVLESLLNEQLNTLSREKACEAAGISVSEYEESKKELKESLH